MLGEPGGQHRECQRGYDQRVKVGGVFEPGEAGASSCLGHTHRLRGNNGGLRCSTDLSTKSYPAVHGHQCLNLSIQEAEGEGPLRVWGQPGSGRF